MTTKGNKITLQLWSKSIENLGVFSCIMLGFWTSIGTAGATISTGCLYFCFVLSGNWRKKFRLLQHPIVILAILIFIWGLIGVLYSAGSWEESLNIALKYNKLLIIWCALYFINGNIKRFSWMLGALALGIILNLIAIYVNYFFIPRAWAISFTGGANWPAAQGHGQYALFTLIFAFSFLATISIKIIDKKWRYLLFMIGALAMVSEIFLNSSRTGYVMEFFVLLFLLFQARKVLAMLGILSFIIVLFGSAYLLSPIFQHRVDLAVTNVTHYTEGKSNTTSVGYRLYFYETSYDILKKNPVDLIFGHGSGSYKTVTQHYFNQLSDKNPNFTYSNFPNPHNQYILFLFENGIIGLLLFLFFLYTLWRYATTLPIIWQDVIIISIIGMAVNMLFNSTFMDYPTSIIFVSITALFASYRPKITFQDLKIIRKPIHKN